MMKEYTIHDVAQHCTHDDLWIIFRGKVYNMTSYYPKHPGSTAMLRYAGKDATNALPLVTAHGFGWNFIVNKLEELQIGVIKKD